jgi:hypothetical protein
VQQKLSTGSQIGPDNSSRHGSAAAAHSEVPFLYSRIRFQPIIRVPEMHTINCNPPAAKINQNGLHQATNEARNRKMLIFHALIALFRTCLAHAVTHPKHLSLDSFQGNLSGIT